LSDLGFNKGCVCIVEIDPKPYYDRLVAVITDEGIVLWFLVRSGGRYILCPKSPKHDIEFAITLEVLGYVHTAYLAGSENDQIYPPVGSRGRRKPSRRVKCAAPFVQEVCL
jgi:hypothetical protein